MRANKTTVAALDILRKARELIDSGEHRFMCVAIQDAGKLSNLSFRMAERVEASIAPHYTLSSWLEQHGRPTDRDGMRRTRLAYLDAWIAKHERALRAAGYTITEAA